MAPLDRTIRQASMESYFRDLAAELDTLTAPGETYAARYAAEQQARKLRLPRLTLYTHEVMTENQAIYAHLGYRETARRTEDGYRRVFMQKETPPSESIMKGC